MPRILPQTATLFLTLILSLYSVAGNSSLPLAPNGYQWRWLAEIQGAFLVPQGWSFADSSVAGSLSFEIKPPAEGDTTQGEGVFIKVLKGPEQRDGLRPSIFAKRLLASYEQSADVMDVIHPKLMQEGKLLVYTISYIDASQTSKRMVRHTLVANDTAGTLYQLRTSCLIEHWQVLDQLEVIATKFYLDDEI